jgi:tRNA nucleotidyltransferase (CCA-adding enzyme)
VLLVLDQAARLNASLDVRFACLCHDLGKARTPRAQWPRHIGHESASVSLIKPLCERWRVPQSCKELALVVAAEHGHIHQSLGFGTAALLRLLQRCDALRRPERFEGVLLACECDARGRTGLASRDYPQAPRLREALAVALSVDTAALASAAQAQGLKGQGVAQHIDAAREAALRQAGFNAAA